MLKQFANVATTIPGPRSSDMLEQWHAFESNKTGYQAQVAIDYGVGAMLYDVDGNAFLDWTSGVLVTNIGHCHPKLVAAVQEASTKIMNVYEYCHPYRTNAARDLIEVAPAHLDCCFFLTTGSEVTDAAMRIMKRATDNFEILSFYGSFHGRTISTASVGGLQKIKKRMGPTMPGILRAPYPYCYRCPFRAKQETCDMACLSFLDDVVQASSTSSMAGLIVEPYLGTAGFIFPPEGYLSALERWARERNLIFTLDEVQSSYGRMGVMWACELYDIKPDIITVGKGIGSGISVAALLSSNKLMDQALDKGEIGSTYGGNPISCSAVSAVLQVMREEDIIGNVKRVESIFQQRLPKLMEKGPFVGDVRGRGLVWGIELVEDRGSKVPAPKLARQLIDLCAQSGLLIGCVGMYGNVIRVAPPLVISEAQAHESLGILFECIAKLR